MSARPPQALHGRVRDLLGAEHLAYTPVGGGCIAHAARVDGPDGPLAFLKWSPAGDPAAATYPAEEVGLAALAATGAVKVPRVLGILSVEGAAGLLLEWMPLTAPSDEAWRHFGGSLARLHAVRPEARPGWPDDNALGPLPQTNAPADGWGDFWWRRRLLPQIDLAGPRLGALTGRLHALAGRLPGLLDEAFEADGTSLLHGDLWSGNVHWTAGGDGPRAALIDPSTYYGHREVDLAMAALFGGFPAPFWRGYEEERPLRPGASRRRPAYQLYYLLAHVNLFGASYLGRTAEAVAALEAGS
ncbi:MAG TPA: fructosamine kinase family protein [Longimicrobiales bacterium]|nr:fructosamine kinase family protein [Longimicrobiales bacterium]